MVQTTNTQSKGHPTGYNLLRNPRLNKGTAFTDAERRKYRLEGLWPPAVTNIELQAARRYTEIANLGDDLQKYLVLSDLQANASVLEHQAHRQQLARSSQHDYRVIWN